FQRSAPHPYLPSFPTRRSSDLRHIDSLAVRFKTRGGVSEKVRLAVTRAAAVAREYVELERLAGRASRYERIVTDFPKDPPLPWTDRKSTRLNSSHEWISYAVFC